VIDSFTMMLPTLLAGFDYVRKNPFALVTVAREAARMRMVVPLELVRWGLGKIRSNKISEIHVNAQPPGIGVGMNVSVMGAQLRVAGVVRIDEIMIGPGILRIELRLNNLSVQPLDANAGGPIQALLASGAIDLAKPGNLMSFLPKKPAMIAEADGDRFVLDLMRVGSLERNTRLQKILGLISPVLSIREVETAGDDLLIGLRVTPTGLPMALAALRM
jgi:hypothetical protein